MHAHLSWRCAIAIPVTKAGLNVSSADETYKWTSILTLPQTAEAINGVLQDSVIGPIPMGASPQPHNPLNTHTIPKVSTTKDMGIVLNARLSAEDNVVSAANKARRMPFYQKRPSGRLPLTFFSPCRKCLCCHILKPHPISSRNVEALE